MATLATCAASSLALAPILRSTVQCKKAGGVKFVGAVAQADLDLPTMESALNFNPDGSGGCGSLTNFILTGGALFNEIQPDGGETSFTSEKQDNGNYLNTLTLYFKGTDCARWCALTALANTCPLVFAIQFADCTKIVGGLEATVNGSDVTLAGSIKPVELTSDSIVAGTVDGDSSSQTVSFTWTTTGYPLCFTSATVPTA